MPVCVYECAKGTCGRGVCEWGVYGVCRCKSRAGEFFFTGCERRGEIGFFLLSRAWFVHPNAPLARALVRQDV